MKKYAFGADVGGTSVKLGLFETDGTLLDTWEIPTRTDNSGEAIMPDIAAAVKAKMESRGITTAEVEGLGIGVPGPVSPDGTVLKCINLGWGVFNVEQEMAALTGLKVKAGNDANVAALGELWQGGGKGFASEIMVTLGTGVGGGVIVDGRIIPGVTGAAGEIGHMPVNEFETVTCNCGKKGCLEQYVSANGFVRITKKYMDEHPAEDSILREMPAFTAKEVCDGAKAGDALCLHMIDELGRILGRALASVACVINPEVFVIGGGMSKAGQVIIDAVQKYFVPAVFHASRGTQFRLAELGNSAGIYGAVKLVLE